jgi:hypothetical protein
MGPGEPASKDVDVDLPINMSGFGVGDGDNMSQVLSSLRRV